jgi:anhydro-N-acetylmuramic acid kinase
VTPPDVYVGLMSGTSTDGVSAAAVRFHERADGAARAPIEAELLGFVQRAYDASQRARLLAAMDRGTARDYCCLAADLGGWLADAASELLAEAGVARADVRAIASHGQTLWHEPGHSTWQAGESAVIAERLRVDVVSDFRVRDVAAGGQGAPLVPIADALLFASADRWRALQNLGGIGNVTVVPPAGAGAGLRAFDTGPGVAVIDGVVRLLHPDLPYDVDGRLARAGVPVEGVASALLADPYFASPPPKSTGRELFSAAYVEAFVARCRAARPACTPADVVATAVELTARSVGDAYHRFVAEPVGDVLVSGGGARNPALFDAVASALAPRTVRRFDEVFFDGEAKEAVAFALLGYLHAAGRPGNVPTATGARGARILGKLTTP